MLLRAHGCILVTVNRPNSFTSIHQQSSTQSYPYCQDISAKLKKNRTIIHFVCYLILIVHLTLCSLNFNGHCPSAILIYQTMISHITFSAVGYRIKFFKFKHSKRYCSLNGFYLISYAYFLF